MGFPLELITMLGSTLLGGVMSFMGQAMKNKAEQQKMLMERANFNAKQVNAARDAGKTDSHFAWTRRLIALSSVFAIIVLPKLVAVWYPEVQVIVGYTEATGGFWNFLFGPDEAIKWKYAQGFVITPLDTHIVSAIVGLYFGAGFTKQNKVKVMASPFDAPIPGQSLTDEPGNAPWEKPAQYDTVEDVAKYYINKLADPDVMDDLSVLFGSGLTMKPFVSSLVTSGVMQGVHTIDAGMLASPIISKFVAVSMDTYGIKVKDESMSKADKSSEREKKRTLLALKLALADAMESGKTAENDAGVSLMQEMEDAQGAPTEELPVIEEQAPMETEQPAAPKGAGLMARGE